MRIVVRALVLLCLALALTAGAHAQVETQSQPEPVDTSETELQGVTPKRLPLLSPQLTGEQVAPELELDGRVRILWRRFSEYRWIFRIENGSPETVGSFTLVIPNRDYDSRIVPEAPYGWVGRREKGQGAYADRWVITWTAMSPRTALPRGKRMEIAIISGAHLLIGGRRTATMLVGKAPIPPQSPLSPPPVSRTSPPVRKPSAWPVIPPEMRQAVPPRLIFPWDEEYAPLDVPLMDADGKSTGTTLEVPFPTLSFLPVPAREVEIAHAVADEDMTAKTVGQGLHAGRVFQMTLRANHPLVAMLKRGTVLVPSLPQYDVFIVGRSERLIMGPHDTATIGLRGYSITYGRKSPPPRVVLHELVYRFPKQLVPAEVATYEKVLERATHLVPVLDTPLGDEYVDTVVQWALWRTQRLLEGNPLTVRDVERDLTQSYRVRQTPKGPTKDYLKPLEIFHLAQRIWSDSDALISDTPPDMIP